MASVACPWPRVGGQALSQTTSRRYYWGERFNLTIHQRKVLSPEMCSQLERCGDDEWGDIARRILLGVRHEDDEGLVSAAE